jgi:hypothetical protein
VRRTACTLSTRGWIGPSVLVELIDGPWTRPSSRPREPRDFARMQAGGESSSSFLGQFLAELPFVCWSRAVRCIYLSQLQLTSLQAETSLHSSALAIEARPRLASQSAHHEVRSTHPPPRLSLSRPSLPAPMMSTANDTHHRLTRRVLPQVRPAAQAIAQQGVDLLLHRLRGP